MAVNLAKIKAASESVGLARTTAKAKISQPQADLGDVLEQARETAKQMEECIEPPVEKDRRKRTGKKSERSKRTPHRFTVRDVKRISRNVVQDDKCKGLVVVSVVAKASGIMDWIDLLIRICEKCREIYALVLDFSMLTEQKGFVLEIRAWVSELRDYDKYLYFKFLKVIYNTVLDGVDYLVNLVLEVMDIPYQIVIYFEPVDDFLSILIRVLKYLKKAGEGIL